MDEALGTCAFCGFVGRLLRPAPRLPWVCERCLAEAQSEAPEFYDTDDAEPAIGEPPDGAPPIGEPPP